MTEWNAGTITTNDVEVPVMVDDVTGAWQAKFGGQFLSADTRDKLKAKLARLTKKSKVEVEVPVIRISPHTGWGAGNITVTRGVLTGIHGRNGNVLARWTVRGVEVKEQLDTWGGAKLTYVGADTTQDQLAEYNRLLRLKAETLEKIRQWESAHVVKPKEAVERAIRARAGADED